MRDTLIGAATAGEAYDRGMTDQQGENTEQGQAQASGLKPLLGPLDIIVADAAGSCSGGVCHFPAPKKR